jgi:anti-sigma factor RsiW
MPSDDRERRFEHALASHLRATSPAGVPGNPPCADSEMLAAYHEGSLPPEQFASVKAHVTTCSRCQEILALLQATDQIPVAVADAPRAAAIPRPAVAAAKSGPHVLPVRKPTRWLWVAPAGALAAALLVWVAVQENSPIRLEKHQAAMESKQTAIATAQPASPPISPSPSLDATRKAETARPDAFSDSHVAPPSGIASGLSQRSRSLPKEKDALSTRNEGTPGGSVNGIVGGSTAFSQNRVTPPASQQSPQSQPPRSTTESVTVQAANADELAKSKTDALQPELEERSANSKRSSATFRPMVPAPAMAPTAPPPPPAQSSEPSQLNTDSATLANQTVEQRESTNLTATAGAAGLRLANAVGAINVSAPGGRISWRIGQAGVIEFSSDAGKSWIVQPSGVITDLLSGSAPSSKVCWVVGRSGTILHTADGGKHWRKLNPPTQDDLRSVFAVDARQATVTTPNASYRTTDGGATWTRLPPE